MFDIQNIRSQFPILSQKMNGKPLIYLDNGATSQKPISVIESWKKYYQEKMQKHQLNLAIQQY